MSQRLQSTLSNDEEADRERKLRVELHHVALSARRDDVESELVAEVDGAATRECAAPDLEVDFDR